MIWSRKGVFSVEVICTINMSWTWMHGKLFILFPDNPFFWIILSGSILVKVYHCRLTCLWLATQVINYLFHMIQKWSKLVLSNRFCCLLMSTSSYVFKLQDPCNLQRCGCTNLELTNMCHGLVHQLISSIKFNEVLALFRFFCYLWSTLETYAFLFNRVTFLALRVF